MIENGRVTPAQEYNTLRDELNQSKKYVFERPLIIVGAGAALLTSEGLKYGSALPTLLIGLLFFNLWFTVNRLKSASRIIAYIQVVLESDTLWKGWETSLRLYRMWTKNNPKFEKVVERELNRKAVPDAMMYYPPIFQIHIALVVVCLIAGFLLMIKQPDTINISANVIMVLLTGLYVRYCWKCKPSRMKSLIEQNIVIWEYALGIKK